MLSRSKASVRASRRRKKGGERGYVLGVEEGSNLVVLFERGTQSRPFLRPAPERKQTIQSLLSEVARTSRKGNGSGKGGGVSLCVPLHPPPPKTQRPPQRTSKQDACQPSSPTAPNPPVESRQTHLRTVRRGSSPVRAGGRARGICGRGGRRG